jgi:hypothetical protein
MGAAMNLSEVLAEMRDAETRAGEIGMRGARTLYRRWVAALEKYGPLIEAAEALRVTEPVEVQEYLKLRERVVSEALALFAPKEGS